MSDPFFGLNINNLQTISATNNTRLQEMNNSITKPLMSSHLPQLPQQQMKTMNTNFRTETAEEESDERKKFEKYRKFQIQQKRLQEMSFSKTVPTNSNSSADKMMANLIQKVESEAKLDKRINNSHKSGLHVYNQSVVQPSMASNVSLISGAVQTPNTSTYSQYSSVGQMSPIMPSIYMNGQQLPQQTTNNYFNSYYPSNQTQKTVVQQMTDSGLESVSYPPITPNSDPTNRSERGYNYLPQMTANQSINSSHISNFNSYSEPIFSITATNGIPPGVTHSNQEPIPSVISPPVVRKLPNCFEDLSKIPALYTKVWNYVKINDISNVCDTNRLYPVLLSVGLQQTILAKLWSIVNQTIPGQLTRHELNMALALIALIQKSSPNPLEEVYKLDSLPVPNIQFFNETTERKASFPEVLQIPTELEPKALPEQTLGANNFEQKTLNQNNYEFSQKLEKNEQNLCQNIENEVIDDKTDDDFDDFKSADFSPIPSVNHSVNELIIESSPQSKSQLDANNVTEDEFDDFKSVTFNDFNQTNPSSESPKSQKPIKTSNLSDALISNISAISSSVSSHNTNPVPPVVTVSSMSSMHSSTDYFQNSLVSSHQSLESSEPSKALNPNFGSVDKYSVFRELSSEPKSEDDFGNFLSHTTNCDAESVDSLQFGHQENNVNNDAIESISHQTLQTCRQIIHKSFNVLVVNHGEDSVLEAIRSTDGNKFASDLSEIYAIVKRLEKTLKSSNKLNNQLIKLIEDIDNTWNSINSVFSKASLNIQLIDENPTEEDNKSSHCAICNSKSSAKRPVLTFAGFDYHISCANLWLNCVNPTLPQPLINSI